MSVERDNQRLERRVQTLEAESERLSVRRVFIFCAAAGGGLLMGWLGLAPAFQILTALAFAYFAFLIGRQDSVNRRLELFRKRLALGRRIQSLAHLDWNGIAPLPPRPDLRLPKYFSDLDLLEGHSLLRLMNHTVSTAGFRRLIAQFNSNGVASAEVRRRQSVAQEAQSIRVLRRRFLVIESLWSGHIESDRILELLEHPLHTGKAPFYFALICGVQALFLGLFALFALVGGTPYFLFAGLALILAYRVSARQISLLQAYGYGMSLDVSLGKFAALAEVIGRMSQTGGPALRDLLKPFAGDRNPRAILARAGRIVGCLGVRQNYILHLAVNLVVPWDFYWTLRLERVRREVKTRLPGWLDTLAELEVFLSLAEFQANHPRFVLPELVEQGPFFIRAENLAHPLLPPDTRIGNGFELNADQRCFLVTGSNMSGKSTFLRSVGVNLLLAKAGTVTCARKFELRTMDLATSLRLNDSLEDGLSSFYAEVRQLKEILDKSEQGVPLLYLVDEVFRGTNNRERLIGSQAFVRRLAQSTACGMITTHDLELAALAQPGNGIHNCHFKEDIQGDRMSFSYQLADGPCPTTNALRVMKLAGLPVD